MPYARTHQVGCQDEEPSQELTVRGNKWSNLEREKKLREYTDGWINYYRYADMKSLMEDTDEWLRRRIRAVYWKQWKKVRTRYKC